MLAGFYYFWLGKVPICHNGFFSFSRLLFPVSSLAAQCCWWAELCALLRAAPTGQAHGALVEGS